MLWTKLNKNNDLAKDLIKKQPEYHSDCHYIEVHDVNH